MGVIILNLIFPSSSYAHSQTGGISYYYQGSHTSSGERFNKHGYTCAHRRLPFGSRVTVTYRGRSVICRVNDRGPWIKGRILDVSLGVAKKLAMTGVGVIHATITWTE